MLSRETIEEILDKHLVNTIGQDVNVGDHNLADILVSMTSGVLQISEQMLSRETIEAILNEHLVPRDEGDILRGLDHNIADILLSIAFRLGRIADALEKITKPEILPIVQRKRAKK